ncbi:MAG: hypothetical protein JWM27_4744 [Gemmatimonadetes bacterium]|nr:hypothetical protein [Gemmatimonadota bacterium]
MIRVKTMQSGEEITTNGMTLFVDGTHAAFVADLRPLAPQHQHHGLTHFVLATGSSWEGQTIGFGAADVETIRASEAAFSARLSGIRRAKDAQFVASRLARMDAARALVPAGHVLAVMTGSKADGWITLVRIEGDGEEIELPAGSVPVWTPETEGAMQPTYYAVPHAPEVPPVWAGAEAVVTEAPAAAPLAVPAAAMEAYRRFSGSADRAWEAGDEQAWALIRTHRHAIEAAGQGSPPAPPVRDDLAHAGEE